MTARIRSFFAVALCATTIGACASGPDPATAGRLAFMTGCWISADGANQEVWSLPRGGVMFGYATTMQGAQLGFFEQSRIDLRQPMAAYTASPDGQRPVIFSEATMTPTITPNGKPIAATSVTFENPEHDYPQRISYRATKKGLEATISRMDGQRPTNYSWVRCK